LNLNLNPLTSFDGTDLTSLIGFMLFDDKGSSNTITPELNNSILNQLNTNGVEDGYFFSSNGRTSASNVDYDNLVSLGWQFRGLELITPPSGNGKLRIKGVNSGGGTTTTTTTEAPTTTTTTTVPPSLYWDSITLGSVDVDGILSLNIDLIFPHSYFQILILKFVH
jgi:hypothetical protein